MPIDKCLLINSRLVKEASGSGGSTTTGEINYLQQRAQTIFTCASPASLKQVLYVHSTLTLALLVVPRAGLGPEHSISSHSGV
ncbi:hypothetical protein PCANC_20959 [Puccinia coronata f. sp. avenae]|uniref:Uncharacterized protein n=1 Tax=Puccinia coronata f. sp. avenae TaxID=200324 RepID=A0A2N5UBK4_9BASI|nr:hypothetical protein PCANC_20959 [Puccinia coronata f. sp. avenae]